MVAQPYSILLGNMQEASERGRQRGVIEYIDCLRDGSYVAPMVSAPARRNGSQLSYVRME